MERAIFAENIVKDFGDKRVLDGISFEVKKGEIFGLLGPSGAGKTTLIKILTGQLSAGSGRAEINGIPSGSLTAQDRRKTGIMMDNFGLYDRFTCYENLKIFGEIYGTSKADILAVLEKVGLEKAAATPAAKLSKGMSSRLRLARVLMTDPEILFLDEPTSGLDPATSAQIHRLMLSERDRGKTIFLTTHTMTEAEKLCGRIVMINEGRTAEQGSPREICMRYDHQRSLSVHLYDGSDISLPYDKSSADRVAELIRSGSARTIHTSEPDLETVFMEITGKELAV